MDYGEDGSTVHHNTKLTYIIDGVAAFIFGLMALHCLVKCFYGERETSPEKTERPSTAPVADQHDHNRIVIIMPGDRNPTCIAMPASSPHHHSHDV
ncbi:hypothetical protein P3S68_006454 [Capsicum galapagoense]